MTDYEPSRLEQIKAALATILSMEASRSPGGLYLPPPSDEPAVSVRTPLTTPMPPPDPADPRPLLSTEAAIDLQSIGAVIERPIYQFQGDHWVPILTDQQRKVRCTSGNWHDSIGECELCAKHRAAHDDCPCPGVSSHALFWDLAVTPQNPFRLAYQPELDVDAEFRRMTQ